MSLNAVSKHIRILERAHLIRRRRVWREHLVSFNPEPLKEVLDWIDKTRAFWTARLDALEELLKTEGAQGGLLKAVLEVTDDEGDIVLEFPFAEAILGMPDESVTKH